MLFDEPKKGAGLGELERSLEKKLAPIMLILTLLVIPSLLLELAQTRERLGIQEDEPHRR